MDIIGFIKKHVWVLLMLLYIYSVISKWNSDGLAGVLESTAGLSLCIAIGQTIYNNFRPIKKIFRWAKYFIGFGMFVWDTSASFLVRGRVNLDDKSNDIKTLVTHALKESGVKTNHDDINTSMDGRGRLNVYIGPLSIHLIIDQTDSEQTDSDGLALYWISVRARTSLRYRNMRKVISGFLIDFFHNIDVKFNPIEQKYSIKVHVEGMSENFFKEQFVREFEPKEVQHFSIRIKNARSVREVTDRQLVITTNKRDELVSAVSSLLLRMT